ncbi:MAG: DUF4136 domain-containing protein [Thermodesulfobacteriota bacterium]
MRKITLALFLLVALLLAGCGGAKMGPAQVDVAATLGPLASYRWQVPPGEARQLRPAYRKALDDAVEKGLAERKMTEAASPDVAVAAYVVIASEKRVMPQGYQVGAVGRRSSSREPEEFVLEVGSILIDLHDPESGELLWRGRSSTEVNLAASEAAVVAQIESGVAAVLARLPLEPR